MIEIPVHNQSGEHVDTLAIDEALLGGEIRPKLLKQAYVRYHANRRQGSAKTRSRAEVAHSGHKLYRQKGTGNARRGDANANILRGGGMAFAKRPKSWRQKMPVKMRRLANRNALLAKAVDGEIKLLDSLDFEKPSTRQFQQILNNLQIDRPCLLALQDVTGHEARSARNIERLSLTQIDRLNAFDLLNHRYVLAEKSAFEAYLQRATDKLSAAQEDNPSVLPADVPEEAGAAGAEVEA
jgi:large subunit ribosomal protein L4